jgi:hypothetical protein
MMALNCALGNVEAETTGGPPVTFPLTLICPAMVVGAADGSYQR